MTTQVGIVLRELFVVEFDFTGRIVELVEIVKGSDLERLRDFSVLDRESDLGLDEIDFGSSSSYADVGSGVVFPWASARRESLAGKVGQRIALGSGTDGCNGVGLIGPSLIRKCTDITRRVGVSGGQ